MTTHPHVRAALARTAALGSALALVLAGCSSSPSDTAGDAAGDAASAPTSATSPTPSPSPSRSATPSPSTVPSAPASGRYVDRIPDGLRTSLFEQGSVPASYADWISTSPEQATVDGRREVRVDRRLPACDTGSATHYPSDRHTAGFAATLFRAGDYVVARQLTVYHDVAEATAALREMSSAPQHCDHFGGKPVTAASYGEFRDAGELDVPQHDTTLAAETSLSVGGGTGGSWWTVLSREQNAIVLTRVVDPAASVADDGSPSDSIDFRQAVLAQARTSAGALDAFAG